MGALAELLRRAAPGGPATGPVKAVWNSAVLAESDETIVLEGNHCFPPESLGREYFTPTSRKTVRPWKGLVSYYTVEVDGERNEAAAWYCPNPSPAARKIKDRVAFWHGVGSYPPEAPWRPLQAAAARQSVVLGSREPSAPWSGLSGVGGELTRGFAMRRGSARWWVLAAMAGAMLAVAGCGDDDDGGAAGGGRDVAARSALTGISESAIPAGFEKTPKIRLEGKEWTFDNVPGHYWKVLDDRGYAMALHFQTSKPFPWAKDARPGELLYIVYAIPGNCGDGSFAKAVEAKDATIVGPTPAGFDHWHGVVGGKSKVGHWLMHIPVRDFTLAGPPGNPMDGTPVKAGNPGFMPVCDIR